MEGGSRRRRRMMASPPPLSHHAPPSTASSWSGDHVDIDLDTSDPRWYNDDEDLDTPVTLLNYVPYRHAATGTIRYTAVEMLLRRPDSSNKRARVAADEDDAALRRQLPEVLLPVAGNECAVCLQDLVGSPEEEQEEGVTPRAMPCSHAFHERCIFQWLRRNRACPVCRRPLPLATPPPAAAAV